MNKQESETDIFFLDVAYWKYLSYREKNNSRGPLKFGIGLPLNNAFQKANVSCVHFYANDLKTQIDWLNRNLKLEKSIKGILLDNLQRNIFGNNSKPGKIYSYSIGLYVVLKQIQYFRPKVVWCFDPKNLPPRFIYEIKKLGCKLIGHISSNLPKSYWLEQYDLLLSSHPEFVKNWNLQGYKSKLFKPFYDVEKIRYVPWKDRFHDLVFLGSNSKDHTLRLSQLEEISKHHQLEIYGSGFEKVESFYNLKKYVRGEIWGDDVYSLYQSTKIAFNSHINLAKGFSANVRMIEAAGSGAVLLTERTDNLNQYFQDDEAVSYASIPEAIESIDFLKKNELEASKIARKGQIRVEKNHTSQNRVNEFKDTILNL